MAGEDAHRSGDEGVAQIRRWLSSTMRVRAIWTTADEYVAMKLEYDWPSGGRSFSFDVGGIFDGGEVNGQTFVAESKHYNSAEGNLGTEYADFLAKCYVVWREHARQVQQFMFVTWHPFNSTKWPKLCTPDAIERGVIRNRARVFGEEDADEARGLFDRETAESLASRLWLVVWSDKQDNLLMSNDDRAIVMRERARQGLI